jgi:cobalt-zinc-cadmium efflux system protein
VAVTAISPTPSKAPNGSQPLTIEAASADDADSVSGVHAPGPRHDHGDRRRASRRALALTLSLTAGFTVAEFVAGLLTGSLALLADAAHMLSDDLSLGVALFAIWLADRPPTVRRTFGYQRAEILAALLNGLTLVAISIWIFVEAGDRLSDPPDVDAGPMLAVACVGLAVNVAAAAILHGRAADSLNVTAAFRHVLADLLGSVGVVAAAIVILTTGWEQADPVISAVIGVMILASSYTIVRDAVAILLEASPRGLDVADVGREMATMPGVVEVHDLHVWTITSGFAALAAHVVVGADTDCHAKRRELEAMLHDRFGLDHTTIQVDHEGPDVLQIENAPRR